MFDQSIKSTRLRFISAVDPTDLTNFVTALPFKVEIKGGPVAKDGRWFLFFVIPDSVPDFANAEL